MEESNYKAGGVSREMKHIRLDGAINALFADAKLFEMLAVKIESGNRSLKTDQDEVKKPQPPTPSLFEALDTLPEKMTVLSKRFRDSYDKILGLLF